MSISLTIIFIYLSSLSLLHKIGRTNIVHKHTQISYTLTHTHKYNHTFSRMFDNFDQNNGQFYTIHACTWCTLATKLSCHTQTRVWSTCGTWTHHTNITIHTGYKSCFFFLFFCVFWEFFYFKWKKSLLFTPFLLVFFW